MGEGGIMAILANNAKLINIGKDYSAGSGIDITDQVISVIGNTVPYSAGENIDIQDFVISSKDWSNDITDASANAFNETTAWVHDNYTNSADVSFLSAEVDKKLDSSAWEAVSGSLATEDYVILSDNLTYARATAFTTAQEYAKESACNSAFNYLNQNKLDVSAFDLPNSGHWNEATNVVEGNSAAWFDNVGDAEVNSFVYTNSSTILDVDSTYQANSASYLTAHQDISNKLDTTAFSTVSGNFLVASSLNGYATESFVENLSGDITALIPTDYATTTQINELSGAVDYVSANAGDQEVNNLVHTNSASWGTVSDKLDSSAITFWSIGTLYSYVTGISGYKISARNAATATNARKDYDGNEFTTAYAKASALNDKLDTTSFSNVSGDFLTTSFGISESAHWEEATNAYEQASGTYLTSHQDLSDYQTIEGMTAYQPAGSYATTNELEQVSADITATIPSTAGLASESYVQTNSAVLTAMIDGKQDTLTFGYDGQDKISAINNSAIAGVGSLDIVPISGTGGVNVYEQNNVLWVSGKDFTSDISYISGTIGDVETLLASL